MNGRTTPSAHRRGIRLIALLICGFAIARCGSSSQTITSPSNVAKCAVTLEAASATLPASGGTGRIVVHTARECQWTAAVDGGWLSIMSGGNGQGEGTVEFRASSNPDPVARTGAIVANDQRASLTQAAGECRMELGESAASFGQSGGSGTVQVQASSALCTWTAQSNDSWISIRGGANGKGTAPVSFDVAPTTGPPRAGSLTIAGQQFSVTQAEGCTFSIAPTSHAATAAGGAGSIAVTAAVGCPWTAISNVDWIRITQGATGSGPGTVAFTVTSTNSTSRAGTIVVAGQTFSVTQGQGCTYSISPASQSVPPAGGNGTVGVATGPGCAWTASSNASWLRVTSGADGSGNGSVAFTATATTGPSRSGTLTVAGQTFTVSQGQGCTFSISPDSQSVPASGGSGTVAVSAGSGCGWGASSQVPWISITAGANGSGDGKVSFTVAETDGPARSGTMTIAGRTFTVNQGQGCSFDIAPSSGSHPSAGGSGEFNITGAGGCGWSATVSPAADWITITAPASGSGNGRIRYSVAANGGPARSGSIVAGGRTFRVDQAGTCTFSISPASHEAPARGGTTSVGVTAADGTCAWTASANAPWISIASGGSGSGSGAVQLAIAANAEGPRSGTVTIAGQTFTINQAGGCTFALAPAEQNVPAGGGTGSFAIAAGGTCAWTASATVPWISVTSPATGSGTGNVQFSVAANTAAARVGTISVSGQPFTVRQEGGCTFTVAPETIAAPAAGATARVDVTGLNECSWTAQSNVAWIALASAASGNGAGAVQIQVQANTGAARSGTLAVGGRTVTVNQESGCTFALDRESFQVGRDEGRRTVQVTADGGCAWTAASNVSWIQVVAGASGTGAGQVEFRFDRNNGNGRQGTLTIAGRTVTVEQAPDDNDED